MSNNKPQLSVIIPCFNHPAELAVMLDSIIANTFQDWELILVDDGSGQDTIDVELAYAAKDRRILALQRDVQPKGAQTCRNIGLKHAVGNYVCFFDSDDYIIPTCFEQRIKAIEEAADKDFVVFPTATYVDGVVCNRQKSFCFGYKYYADDIAAFCEMTLPFIVCSNIYRRKSLLEHDIQWDTKLVTYHDELFNLLCLTKGMTYEYAKNAKPDYAYRLSTVGSVSKQTNAEPYLSNSLYAMEWRFKAIQKAYGNRYNHQLYRGAWHTWFANSRHGRVPLFTRDMKSLVMKYAPAYGRLFGLYPFLFLYLVHIVCSKVKRNFLLKTND